MCPESRLFEKEIFGKGYEGRSGHSADPCGRRAGIREGKVQWRL